MAWIILSIILDAIFWVDLVLNFFSAYFNHEEKLVDKKKQIAYDYLRSWFIVDFISVAPFYIILNHGIYDFFKFVRVVRIGRIIKNFK